MPGDGTLLGAGDRWLLVDARLDDEQGAELADRLWGLVTATTPGALDATVDALLEACGDDVSFALVDLSPAHGTSLTRGTAVVAESDGAHLLSLRADRRPGTLRLTGGIVGAESADLRPVRPPARLVVATGGISAAPPPPAVEGLIDGIPADILASRASDPPPAPTPVVTADPVEDSRRRLEERIGHTVRRSADPDHDGRTTHRPADGAPADAPGAAPDHLHQPTHETVLAVRCTAGHLTAAFVPACRVCAGPVPPQEPARLPRPQLGILRLPEGDTVPLDRGVVLGRQPTAPPETDSWPHLVRVPQHLTYISRIHLRIELDGWLVLATDLGSRSGTTLRAPGRPPERIRAHQQYVWEPGQVLDLADSFEIEYRTEVEA